MSQASGPIAHTSSSLRPLQELLSSSEEKCSTGTLGTRELGVGSEILESRVTGLPRVAPSLHQKAKINDHCLKPVDGRILILPNDTQVLLHVSLLAGLQDDSNDGSQLHALIAVLKVFDAILAISVKRDYTPWKIQADLDTSQAMTGIKYLKTREEKIEKFQMMCDPSIGGLDIKDELINHSQYEDFGIALCILKTCFRKKGPIQTVCLKLVASDDFQKTIQPFRDEFKRIKKQQAEVAEAKAC